MILLLSFSFTNSKTIHFRTSLTHKLKVIDWLMNENISPFSFFNLKNFL